MFGLYEDERRDDPYNPNDGSLYVNPFRSGDKSAQDTLADLYENEFQDYLNRFFPVEQDLIQQMTTGFEGLQQEEIGRAQSAVAKQYANTKGQAGRRQAGYGLGERQGFEQDYQRSETSALVAARNFARSRSNERRMQILSGGTGSALTQRSVTGDQNYG
tara:strand:- start:745 stop:1224 length:480 start_codon:yes stop_codon:yes gene_type:complete